MTIKISNFKFQISKTFIGIVIVIIIAAVLRLWAFGTVPASPDWDEAALGYNAYSILHTGRDEYGQFLPVVLRSFDDYKPALYSYLIIPFLFVFGLSIQAVRMPSILFGVITIVVVFYLSDELFHNKKLSFLIALLLALSPWHIQFSRIGFESNVGLSLNVLGIFLFLKGLKKHILLFASIASFCASLYVYQSEKVFTPLVLLLLVVIYHKQVLAISKKYLSAVCIVGLLLVLPMGFYLVTNPNALARAKGVSVFSDTAHIAQASLNIQKDTETHDYLGFVLDNRRLIFAKEVVADYLSHFDLKWLFITGDVSRHHAPNMGLIYLWELPFLLAGIYFFLFSKYDKRVKFLILGWFLLSPVPASITTGVPHAVRTLNFLPTWQIFIAFGVVGLYEAISKRPAWFRWSLVLIVSAFALFNVAYYLDQYFVQQNYYTSLDWQYGYKEAVSFLSTKKADHIIVSNQPPLDQSYMFFLFYLQYDPATYQAETKNVSGGFREDHQFGKYTFRPINWTSEKKDSNTLYVGRPTDFTDSANSIITIHYLNGQPAIEIVQKE